MELHEETIKKSTEIAQGILNGLIQPNTGCSMNASLCEHNGWPVELTPFLTLAHEQYNHEELGFDPENSIPLILEECRLLVKIQPNPSFKRDA